MQTNKTNQNPFFRHASGYHGVRDPSQSFRLVRSRKVRSGPVRNGKRSRTTSLRLPPILSWTEKLHRTKVCHHGGESHSLAFTSELRSDSSWRRKKSSHGRRPNIETQPTSAFFVEKKMMYFCPMCVPMCGSTKRFDFRSGFHQYNSLIISVCLLHCLQFFDSRIYFWSPWSAAKLTFSVCSV